MQPPSSSEELPVDLQALEAWMDGRALGHGPLDAAELLGGGTQNILLRFRRAERTYVLRRPPLHKRKNSDETMRREARVLDALAGSDVPHPALIAAEADDGVLGASFYLMEPVDGFNATVEIPDLHRSSPDVGHRMGLALAEGIATLACIDHTAVGLDGFGRVEGYLDRQVSRWWSQLESYSELAGYHGPDIPGLDQVAAWLEANQPTDFTPGIMHGDYHLANVMYRRDSPELAAIVDWELCTVGDPLVDLGVLLATWAEGDDTTLANNPSIPGLPTAAELVSHYGERSDRDISAVAWYTALACYKLGIILEGTHARASAGQAPKATGDMLHATTLALFARATRVIANV